jgi:hypothetical protein
MHATDQPSLSSLLGGIIDDIQRLFRQEFALARSEVFNEWNKTKTATTLLAGGGAVLALGAILLAFMVVKLIALALPEWAGFLIVGGVIAILGGFMIHDFRGPDDPPPNSPGAQPNGPFARGGSARGLPGRFHGAFDSNPGSVPLKENLYERTGSALRRATGTH